MKRLEFEQGSAEWLAFRRTKVTASDIATIMCGSQQEVYDLYLEKVEGKQKFRTQAMIDGEAMEQEAREWFFGTRKKIERPCIMNSFCDWFMASLDGYHEPTQTLLEIKCPKVIPDDVESYPRYKRAYWQMQGQFFASGVDSGVLLLYGPLVQKKAIITRSEADIALMLEKGHEFYERIIFKNPPPKPEGLILREDQEAIEWAKEFREIDEQLKELEEQKKILRDVGIAIANEMPFECEGVSVSLTKGRETPDYEKAIKVLCPGADLSQFMKVSKPSWRITA